jgi:hypothetical protein
LPYFPAKEYEAWYSPQATPILVTRPRSAQWPLDPLLPLAAISDERAIELREVSAAHLSAGRTNLEKLLMARMNKILTQDA